MNLEQRLNRPKKVLRKTPSHEVLEQVNEGKKFIPVEDDFDTPIKGYTLLNMKYGGDSFKLLVPQSFLFYVANQGEGMADDALDELGDFYEEAEDYEKDLISEGSTNVQEANIATDARGAYKTYLINKLVTRTFERDDDGEPVAEFDQSTLNDLDLKDEYVANRVKGMAALALNLSVDEVKEYGVGDLLKHVTVMKNKTETLTEEEFKKVTCWAGSHYELKKEYRDDPDVSYEIEYRHKKSHRVGTKTTSHREFDLFDHRISQLESEITSYRKEKHGEVGRHDPNLIRTYANLQYIAKKDPTAQLDVVPAKEKKK